MAATWLNRLLYSEGRLRPPWRILLFFLFFALLAIAGQIAVSVLPRDPLQWGSLIVATSAALGAGWLMLAHLDKRPFGALGFPLHGRVPAESFVGLLVGGVLIGTAVLLLLLSRSAYFVPDAGNLPGYAFFLGWTLLYFAIAAAWEEAIFRGYPFQVLVEWIGALPATLIASAIFAYLHSQNPNVTPLALANIFLAGVMLSIAYLKTRSLWFATGVHLGWNWTMASLLDFPVSGLDFETPIYSGIPRGEDWWTGGAFGPEAGIVGTIVLAVGTLLLFRTRRVRVDPEMQQLRPIVDRRLREGGGF